MDVQIRELSLEEARQIYTEAAVRHFPADELKPFHKIEMMWHQGAYMGLGIYAKTVALDSKTDRGSGSEFQSGLAKGLDSGLYRLAGYALFVKAFDSNILLIDYLAVLEDFRQCGVGSIFLGKIKEYFRKYDGMLIETEDIRYAHDDAEQSVRQRRNAFYDRNGAVVTGFYSQVYGVPYEIRYLPFAGEYDENKCREALELIYHIIVPGPAYEKHVIIN